MQAWTLQLEAESTAPLSSWVWQLFHKSNYYPDVCQHRLILWIYTGDIQTIMDWALIFDWLLWLNHTCKAHPHCCNCSNIFIGVFTCINTLQDTHLCHTFCFFILGIEIRALPMLSTCSATELHTQAPLYSYSYLNWLEFFGSYDKGAVNIIFMCLYRILYDVDLVTGLLTRVKYGRYF